MEFQSISSIRDGSQVKSIPSYDEEPIKYYLSTFRKECIALKVKMTTLSKKSQLKV